MTQLPIQILKVWSSDDPHPQQDYLDSLWTQILSQKQNEWREGHIIRLYSSFQTDLSEATSHELSG
jgi:nuclear cap-binding protein subunit 1